MRIVLLAILFAAQVVHAQTVTTTVQVKTTVEVSPAVLQAVEAYPKAVGRNTRSKLSLAEQYQQQLAAQDSLPCVNTGSRERSEPTWQLGGYWQQDHVIYKLQSNRAGELCFYTCAFEDQFDRESPGCNIRTNKRQFVQDIYKFQGILRLNNGALTPNWLNLQLVGELSGQLIDANTIQFKGRGPVTGTPDRYEYQIKRVLLFDGTPVQ
jgi:hypothetical protein